jgi:hypothetical protein
MLYKMQICGRIKMLLTLESVKMDRYNKPMLNQNNPTENIKNSLSGFFLIPLSGGLSKEASVHSLAGEFLF